ncbi:hypothetical protein PVL29_008864 [Vitis rotundifolia]|uniref:Uncharacterized protein n=1 Tax=Vitis rotundifolia TaxID=103349 RepID=A0AA39DTY9_VITRO|nr:hypothetical protein PVL29_008864 [Vitis rotundifolia]
MGFTCRKSLFMMLFPFLVFSGWRIGEVEAVRPLHGGEQWAEGNGVLRQSLQAGLLLPSGPSPCTHIPRKRGGRCALNEMNMLLWLPLLRIAMLKIVGFYLFIYLFFGRVCFERPIRKKRKMS